MREGVDHRMAQLLVDLMQLRRLLPPEDFTDLLGAVSVGVGTGMALVADGVIVTLADQALMIRGRKFAEGGGLRVLRAGPPGRPRLAEMTVGVTRACPAPSRPMLETHLRARMPPTDTVDQTLDSWHLHGGRDVFRGKSDVLEPTNSGIKIVVWIMCINALNPAGFLYPHRLIPGFLNRSRRQRVAKTKPECKQLSDIGNFGFPLVPACVG